MGFDVRNGNCCRQHCRLTVRQIRPARSRRMHLLLTAALRPMVERIRPTQSARMHLLLPATLRPTVRQIRPAQIGRMQHELLLARRHVVCTSHIRRA